MTLPEDKKHLYLIGPRGCGKTTVGQVLAQRLGWNWVDLDQIIQETAGQSIAEIFTQRGQTAFRDMESEQLQIQSRKSAQVVSLGGGAVLRQENQRVIQQTGRVIFLKARVETLVERITADPASAALRPSLLGPADPDAQSDPVRNRQRMLEEVQQVLALRLPTYQQASDLQLDTTTLEPAAVVDQILRWLPRVDQRFATQPQGGTLTP